MNSNKREYKFKKLLENYLRKLPPIHGAAEEVSPAVVAPYHGAVDLL